MEKRIRLTVAYDGTAYHGWQAQDNAISVEAVLTDAIEHVTGTRCEVIGASRTDAGVHAYGNIAVFDCDTPIPGDKILYSLNKALPADIRIMASDEVPSDWHPRKQECRKSYEYHILQGSIPLPTKRLYAHYIHQNIDLEAMQSAAPYFVGEHDFAAFCSAGAQVSTTVRTIYECEVLRGKDPEEIVIRVCGNGFLYNMVRIIAGTLLDVGLGRKKAEDIPAIIESLDRTKAGPTLPPQGLFLMGYDYTEA